MVEFGSLQFWLIATLLVLLVRALRPAPERRRWLFFVATVVLYWQAPIALAGMLLLAAYGYFALRRCGTRDQLILHMIVLVAVFLNVVRFAAVLGDANVSNWLPLVGLPYVVLRLAHLMFEVNGERLEPPAAADYVCYLLPFHQLFAGPIERYSQYQAAIYRPLEPLTDDSVLQGLNRLSTGLVKQWVLAELLQESLGFHFERTGLPLWLEVNCFALHIYLNFSGYMDIMIGLGRLAGWTPPENFNWPYLSRNIITFWTRWHITLSFWIRDYVFIPLNMALQRRLPRGSTLLAGSLSYLGAMVLCGLWHRPDLGFILWGAIHGLGIIACKVYEAMLKKLLSKPAMKAYRRSRVASLVAGFVTFQFIAVSFVFAFNPIDEAWQIVGKLFGAW